VLDLHRLVVNHLGLDAVFHPHLKGRGLQASRPAEIT
jgi:hypothetical protein